jgi:hypothetical protein
VYLFRTNGNDDACSDVAIYGGLKTVANLVEMAWCADVMAFGQQKWNLLTLGLCLLINLIEHNGDNRYMEL